MGGAGRRRRRERDSPALESNAQLNQLNLSSFASFKQALFQIDNAALRGGSTFVHAPAPVLPPAPRPGPASRGVLSPPWVKVPFAMGMSHTRRQPAAARHG